MNYKKEIIRTIDRISGKYSAYEIFSDWIRVMAMSISNSTEVFHGGLWLTREQLFLDTMRKYEPEEQVAMCEMFAWLTETMDEGPDDILGAIYMESGMGSSVTGQFFTPFHLSEMTAKLSLNVSELRSCDDLISLNEPSCGGGGMIIAAVKALHEAGINYQKRIRVIAQDLDWKGVYMTYVQLSLLGIDALCVQGNTLSEPYNPAKTKPEQILRTPKHMGMLI